MEYAMRRKDREVKDHEIILGMVQYCDTVYIGSNDDIYPYIVPVSFGAVVEEGHLKVFIHSALAGRKVEAWKQNPKVSLVFAKFFDHPDERIRGSIHDYRSVMANGTIRRIDYQKDGQLWRKADRVLLQHYDRAADAFEITHCKNCDLYEIDCDMNDVSAKSEKKLISVEDIQFDPLTMKVDPSVAKDSAKLIMQHTGIE